jgi:hypothetical protein
MCPGCWVNVANRVAGLGLHPQKTQYLRLLYQLGMSLTVERSKGVDMHRQHTFAPFTLMTDN